MYSIGTVRREKNKNQFLWSVKKMRTWQHFFAFLHYQWILNIISSIVFALIHFLIFKENKKRLKQMILIQDVYYFHF
jgi:hypothetical protein